MEFTCKGQYLRLEKFGIRWLKDVLKQINCYIIISFVITKNRRDKLEKGSIGGKMFSR